MRRAIKMVGLVLCLAGSACDGAGEEAPQFVGRWRAEEGTSTKVCPGEGERNDPVAGDVVWINGGETDLASTTPLTPCRLKANVTGETATIVPGPACTVSDGAGGVVRVSVDSYTFVLMPLGAKAMETASGQITHVHDGVATTCSFSQTARYRRVTSDEATPDASVR